MYWPLEDFFDRVIGKHRTYQRRARLQGFREEPASQLLVHVSGTGYTDVVDRAEAAILGLEWVETME